MKKNIEYAFYILLTYTESWSDTISNTSITAAQVTIIKRNHHHEFDELYCLILLFDELL